MSTKRIILLDVQEISFVLAVKKFTYKEPIPPFETRFPNKLESCLLTPFQKFDGKDLYPGLIKKASILLYLLISNHPFQNGNKRVALTTLLYFLLKNKKYLNVDFMALYNFTVWIAASPAELKNQVISGIELFLETYLVSTENKNGQVNFKNSILSFYNKS